LKNEVQYEASRIKSMLSTFNLILAQARSGEESLNILKMALVSQGFSGSFGEVETKPAVSCYHIKQMKPYAISGF